MTRITSLSLPLDYTSSSLRSLLLRKLKLTPDQLLSFRVTRRSVDARNRQDVHFVLSVDLKLQDEQSALRHNKNLVQIQSPQKAKNHSESFILNSYIGPGSTSAPSPPGSSP